MKRLATCLVALVAFAGAPAAAEAGVPSDATWDFAHDAGIQYWSSRGYEVCPYANTVNYRWFYRPRADWLAQAFRWGDPRCEIDINTSVKWRAEGRWYGRSGRATYCAVVVHEYGHLAGRKHTRRGIMRGDSTIYYPAICGY